MKKKIVFIFVLGLSVPASSQPQNHMTLFGGYSIPFGDYGDSYGNKAGLATNGPCFGIEHTISINRYANFSVNAFYIINGVNEANMENYVKRMDVNAIDIDAGSYTNIIIMPGIGLKSIDDPRLDVYASAQAGIAFINAPDLEMRSENTWLTMELNTTSSFGFGIGVGLIFYQKLNLGVRYLNLGEPKMTPHTKVGKSLVKTPSARQPISMFLLLLGVRL
jgi:hypothetical protein